MLRARILGAAAGGGLPQWNCGCHNCSLARSGVLPGLTQSSLAVSGDGIEWVLLNASPDVRMQLAAAPVLHPTGPRRSPLRAVLLTNGDIDHVAGLLGLRERQPFTLFATQEILDMLADNPIFDVLAPDLVARRPIRLGEAVEVAPGLVAEFFSVPGKVPLYLEDAEVATDLEGEQTVGLRLDAGGEPAFYIPGCAAVTPALADRLRDAALVLFDGTLWRDDEMIAEGVGTKTGRRMGHVSMSGPDGAIAAFAGLNVRRKIFVHMNNTNPVLRPDSSERAEATAAGWEIGFDGMELQL